MLSFPLILQNKVSSMQKLRKKVLDLLPALTLLICILQPVLDVFGFWAEDLRLPDAVLTVLRALGFLAFILTVFMVSRRKKRFVILAAAILIYLGCHFWAVSRPGLLNLYSDIKEQMRILMLLPLTLSFVCAFEENPRTFSALKRGLLTNLIIICAVMLISSLTGTDPHTYFSKNTGVLGWFLWPNGQCAILCVLSVIALTLVCRRWPGKLLPMLGACAVCFLALFLLGTRISFAAIPAIGAGLFVCLLVSDRRLLPTALTVLLVALAFTAMYPFSPTARSQKRSAENALIKQERINAAVAPYGVAADAKQTDNPDALAAAYRYGLQGLVDRFGLETVSEKYGGSLAETDIFDNRQKKIVFNELLMEEQGTPAKLFGIEVSRMRQRTQYYDFYPDNWVDMEEIYSVENDFHGIFFSGGLCLLLLICGLFLAFGLQALLVMIRRPKSVMQPEWIGFAGAFCFVILTSLLTSALLRQANGTVYVAAVLAGLRHLSLPANDQTSEGAI